MDDDKCAWLAKWHYGFCQNLVVRVRVQHALVFFLRDNNTFLDEGGVNMISFALSIIAVVIIAIVGKRVVQLAVKLLNNAFDELENGIIVKNKKEDKKEVSD